ncbi:MAG: chemotaxis protein CheB [Flavisolibacter sp.]
MDRSDDINRIVVIGASAGGLTALTELVSQLKKEWNAAYCIVLHLSRKGISDYLVYRLQEFTELHCVRATEGLSIKRGHIYVAMPNFHLLVKKDEVKLGHGPAENRWRPSIDVLFRSAAAAYGNRTVGIILTGLLDDGVSGMSAIKRSGGTLIVQDPNEAEYPDMPLSVLSRMEVDHCVLLSLMGTVVQETLEMEKKEPNEIPHDVVAEAQIAEQMASGIDLVSNLGENSVYTCPDCGGVLFQVEQGKLNRFRCNTGHVYAQDDLEIKQTERLEETLWVALRMMEERRNLLQKMEQQMMERGFARLAREHKKKLEELHNHIEKLKQILYMTQNNNET